MPGPPYSKHRLWRQFLKLDLQSRFRRANWNDFVTALVRTSQKLSYSKRFRISK